MQFNLIPADFKSDPFTSKFAEPVGLVVITDDNGNIRITHETNRTFDGNAWEATAWGFLELFCLLTKRYVRFLVPVAEGHTVQSINQSPLVGEMFKASNDTIITVRKVRNVVHGEDIIFTDGELVTFAAKHVQLSFCNQWGSHVHVFCKGSDTLGS